uniref:Testis expressed 48 n=1 Tax=Ursus maritimus TaxID=29073 RepID=A0A452TL10_URSMA
MGTAHQNLASKVFCLCCRDCEGPHAADDSKVPSHTREHQPWTCSRYENNLNTQKKEYCDQGGPSKPDAEVPPSIIISSFLPLGRNTRVCPRGFYKRNLNRYSQDHWPFQPCHIGRP